VEEAESKEERKAMSKVIYMHPDQATNKHMCSYSTKGYGGCRPSDPHSRAHIVRDKDWTQKRVKVQCPVCKRKLDGWLMMDHDGVDRGYAIPKHKRKGWWKKKKVRKK